MSNYCRVKIPILQVIPIRKAEEGMTLEEAAFNRGGQVVAEEGTTLDEEKIEKFQNLNVRKVVVLNTKIQWLPQDKVEESSRDLDVLETKTFEEASEKIIEDLQRTDSVETLRQTAMHLRKQAAGKGDHESVDYLDNLIQRTYDLENEIDELINQLDNVDDPEARQTILNALEGKIRELDETLLEVAAPDSTIHQTINCCTEKEEIRSSLTDFLSNNPNLLEQTEAEVEDSQKVHRPEINKDRSDFAESVKHLLENDNSTDDIKTFVDEITSRAPSSYTDDAIESVENEINKLIEKKKILKNQLSDMDLQLEHRKKVLNALNGNVSLHKSDLLELPIPQAFAKKSYDLMRQEMDMKYRLWKTTDEATNGELENLLNKSEFLNHVQFGELLQDEETDAGAEQAVSPSGADKEATNLNGHDDTKFDELDDNEVLNVLDEIEAFNYKAAIRKLKSFLEMDNLPKSLTTSLNKLEENLLELQSREKSIRNTVKDSDEVSDDVEATLVEYINGEKELDPESVLEIDAPVGLLESVADFLVNRQETMQKFWQQFDLVSEYDFSDSHDPDAESSRLSNRVANMAESLGIQPKNRDDDISVEESDEGKIETNDSLVEKIRNLDPFELSNLLDLDISTLKEAKKVLSLPNNLSDQQQEHCLPLLDEAEKIFYGREIDDGGLLKASRQLADVMVDHKKPLKMLVNPPAGDEYLLSHGVNTCMLMLRLANDFGFNDTEILDLATSSLSLDFGMIEIPTGLWAKNDNLTRRADNEVKKHPIHSRKIVNTAANGDSVIQDLVHQHHERNDGSGYPQGLTKDSQHPHASLLGAADTYVAMLEDRVYRSAKPPDVAMKTLLKSKDKFGTSVVRTLVESIGIYPNGTLVLLGDGRLGIVIGQNYDNLINPKVMVITDAEQNKLSNPDQKNLSESDLTIKKTLKW